MKKIGLAMLTALIAAPASAEDANFAAVRQIIVARCGFCHSAILHDDGQNGGSQPAKGVKFDTLADYRKFAPLILASSVKSSRMPPGNATHMSGDERMTLGKWVESGAAIPGPVLASPSSDGSAVGSIRRVGR